MQDHPSLRLWYSGIVASALAAIALLCVALYTVWEQETTIPAAGFASSSHSSPSQTPSFTFNYASHGNDHSLSDNQCDSAFPHLFDVLDDTAAARRASPVNETELEAFQQNCLVRVLIYEAEIFIVYGINNPECWIGNVHERTTGFLHSIYRAIIAAPPSSIPNVEFLLDVDDDPQRPISLRDGEKSRPEIPVWGLTRKPHQNHIWLAPDYGYWAWPGAGVASHAQTRRKADEINAQWPWTEKIRKVIWRGTTHLNPVVREPLVETTKDQSWADVAICSIHDPETKHLCITQYEHCRYAYTVHTEGFTYSGRLKYLQLCRSVPIVHELAWAEHHTHLLQPNGSRQNYVAVHRDWSDLEQTVGYYLEHDDEAQQIAEESHEMFARRHLTPAAVSCYWRRMIQRWADVQGYEPQLYELDENGEKKLRGVPFEAYAINFKKPMPSLQ